MAFDLKELARRGAEARLAELRAEIAEIERAFPGLSGNGRARELIKVEEMTSGRQRRRKRKPMTAAQKKAVGERMKKYWAARRKAE